MEQNEDYSIGDSISDNYLPEFISSLPSKKFTLWLIAFSLDLSCLQYRFLVEHGLLLTVKQIIVCQPPKPQITLQIHNEESGHLNSAPNKAP